MKERLAGGLVVALRNSQSGEEIEATVRLYAGRAPTRPLLPLRADAIVDQARRPRSCAPGATVEVAMPPLTARR